MALVFTAAYRRHTMVTVSRSRTVPFQSLLWRRPGNRLLRLK